MPLGEAIAGPVTVFEMGWRREDGKEDTQVRADHEEPVGRLRIVSFLVAMRILSGALSCSDHPA